MGSVIEFSDARIKKKGQSKEKKTCRSPIVVTRLNSQAILVKFQKTLFDGERLSCAIHNLFTRQDYWKLFEIDPSSKHYDANYYGFVVSVVCSDKFEKEYALNQAFYLMQHEAYRIEAQLRFLRDYAVSDLTKLKKLAPLSIPSSTAKTLNDANIFSLYDLALHTREELSGIPGMTTSEIYQTERTLASLGWYLQATLIPSC